MLPETGQSRHSILARQEGGGVRVSAPQRGGSQATLGEASGPKDLRKKPWAEKEKRDTHTAAWKRG